MARRVGTPRRPSPGIASETFQVGTYEFVLFDLPLRCPAPVHFTAAERAILEHVRAGLTSAQIAKVRGTSPRTVANQLNSMYRKARVGSRHELIALLGGD